MGMGKENAGKEVVLYYYNEETGKLEKVQTCKVDKDGIAVFTFEHASDYVAVISDKAADKDDSKTPQTGDMSNINLYVMMLVIAGAAIVMVVLKVLRCQKLKCQK